jgi:hypothetical protein
MGIEVGNQGWFPVVPRRIARVENALDAYVGTDRKDQENLAGFLRGKTDHLTIFENHAVPNASRIFEKSYDLT